MACTLAELYSLRVAVLVETPAAADLFEDLATLSRSGQEGKMPHESALRGLVDGSGNLVEKRPFACSRPPLEAIRSFAVADALPPAARQLITNALQRHPRGLLLFGTERIEDHSAAIYIDAALALTEHAGPAARIIPRKRSTPSKDWLVPEATKRLPYLPSVESAYERGYRRMIVVPYHTDGAVIKEYAPDVLFLSGSYGSEASTFPYRGFRGLGSSREEFEILSLVVGFFGMLEIPTKRHGLQTVMDVFLGTAAPLPPAVRSEDVTAHIQTNRVIRWEEGVEQLLTEGLVTMSALKALKRPQLAQRLEKRRRELAQPGHPS